MLSAIHLLALCMPLAIAAAAFPLQVWDMCNCCCMAGMQQASEMYWCGRALSEARATSRLLNGSRHIKRHIYQGQQCLQDC